MTVEPGWYFARKKSWSTDKGFEPVKVTRIDSSTFNVWQCADPRPWPIDAWDFGRQIFPDIEHAIGLEQSRRGNTTND